MAKKKATRKAKAPAKKASKSKVVTQLAALTSAAISKIDQAKARKELAKLKKKYQAAEKKAKSYIKSNPGKALLLAAGVGAAIGAGVAAIAKKALPKKGKKR